MPVPRRTATTSPPALRKVVSRVVMSMGPMLPWRSLMSTSLVTAVRTSPAQTVSRYSTSVPPFRMRVKPARRSGPRGAGGPAGGDDGGAEEAGGRRDVAVAAVPRHFGVEVDGVAVADGAGELAAAGAVDFVGDGLGLAADGGAHFVGDDRGLGHGRLLRRRGWKLDVGGWIGRALQRASSNLQSLDDLTLTWASGRIPQLRGGGKRRGGGGRRRG